MATTFDVDGIAYDIHFNINSEITFENIRNKTMVDALYDARNFIMFNDLIAFFTVGLYYANGGKLSPKQITDIATKAIDEKGPGFFTLPIIEALERDCSFLLRGADNEDTIE